MSCAWECEFRNSQLLHASQTLKLGNINQPPSCFINFAVPVFQIENDEAVDWVTYSLEMSHLKVRSATSWKMDST